MKIITERLYILPPRPEDLEDLYNLQSDPDVMRYVGSGARDKETVRKGLEQAIRYYERYQYSLGSVFEKETNQFVGRAGLRHLDFDDNQEVEIAYGLLKSFWNKGYATELAKGMVEWGFSHLPVDVLVAVVQVGNVASEKVLQNAGMHYVKDYPYHGAITRYYQIDRHEYERRKQGNE